MIAIDPSLLADLREACSTPALYKSREAKKRLQVMYEMLLNSCSRSIFGRECTNRMMLRADLNSLDGARISSIGFDVYNRLISVLQEEGLLYSKSYSDTAADAEKFLQKYLCPLLLLFDDGQH